MNRFSPFLNRLLLGSTTTLLRLSGAIAVFGLTAWLSRRFGTEAYGAFAYFAALASFLGPGCQLGLDFVAIKALPLHRGGSNAYPRSNYTNSVFIICAVSVMVSLVVISALVLIRPFTLRHIPTLVFLIIIPGLVLAPINSFHQTVFTAAGYPTRGYAIDRLVFSILVFVITLIAAALGFRCTWPVMLAFTLANFGLFILYVSQLAIVAPHLSDGSSADRGKSTAVIQLIKSAASDGLLSSLSQFVDQISPVFVTILAGFQITATETALLATALSLGGVLNLTVQSYEATLLAPIAAAIGGEPEKRRHTLASLWGRSATFAVCAVVVTLAGATFFGRIVLGFISPSFVSGLPLLLWILTAFGARALCISAHDILLLSGRGRLAIKINIACLGILFAYSLTGIHDLVVLAELFCSIHLARAIAIAVAARSQLRVEQR